MRVAAPMKLNRIKATYAHAIGNGYRFHFYEDASPLLLQGAARWVAGGCLREALQAAAGDKPRRTAGHLIDAT